MEFSNRYLVCLLCILFEFVFDSRIYGACDGIKPCIPLSKANAQFKKCCLSRELGDDCSAHCRYDVTLDELKSAVFKTKECELTDARDILQCASNKNDNDKCCRKTGVLDGAREVCEPFCNPYGPNWPKTPRGKMKYLKCISQFDQILQCHYASLR